MIEIERRFLVKPNAILHPQSTVSIIQGYLEKGVRVRLIDNHSAFLTIKGKNQSETVLKRNEFEYVIPVNHATEILNMCGNRIITKFRSYINHIQDDVSLMWEIDTFTQKYHGLVIAEIELKNVEDSFVLKLPDWIDTEITMEKQYSNSYLAYNN